MDNDSYNLLRKLKLERITLIKLSDFEDGQLREAKKTRSPVEYCWTCTPSLPLYILKKNPDMDMISYLDADLFFFYSPEEIYKEFGNNSVMIIPHRYSRECEPMEEKNGIYNVGMLIFRNDANALECLNWWRGECLKWCYAHYEDGKLGDQLYLNDWPKKFRGVYILKNNGANVASWNIEKYYFGNKKNNPIIWQREKGSEKEYPLIFYHFHGINLYVVFDKIKILSKNLNDIAKEGRKVIFTRYSEGLWVAKAQIAERLFSPYNYGLNNIWKYMNAKCGRIILNQNRILKKIVKVMIKKYAKK